MPCYCIVTLTQTRTQFSVYRDVHCMSYIVRVYAVGTSNKVRRTMYVRNKRTALRLKCTMCSVRLPRDVYAAFENSMNHVRRTSFE